MKSPPMTSFITGIPRLTFCVELGRVGPTAVSAAFYLFIYFLYLRIIICTGKLFSFEISFRTALLGEPRVMLRRAAWRSRPLGGGGVCQGEDDYWMAARSEFSAGTVDPVAIFEFEQSPFPSHFESRSDD